VKEFIVFCRKTALVHLRRRAAAGRLPLDKFGLSLDDAAIDCIADLFTRDDSGRFVQIAAYFEGIPVESSSSELLFSHLRRLIFARVNNNIFRLYTEQDPAFAKILRNTKLAISSLNNFDQVDNFGEPWIVPSLCDPLDHLPPPERDVLERRLHAMVRGDENIPTMLSRFALYLRDQDEHSRRVPLFSVAMIIAHIYQRSTVEPENIPDAEDRLLITDAMAVIRQTCADIRAEMEPQYVHRKKIPPTVYAAYFSVIVSAMEMRLTGEDGEEYSYYEKLTKHLPAVTQEEYKSDHKAKLEYLGRLVQHRAAETLKETR